MFVIAQVAEGSAALDHDTLTTAIKRSVEKISKKMSPDDARDSTSYLLGYMQNLDTGTRVTISEGFAEKVHNTLGVGGRNPLLPKSGPFGEEKSFPAAKILMLYLAHYHEEKGDDISYTKGHLEADREYWHKYPENPDEFTGEDREDIKSDIEDTKNRWPLGSQNINEAWREAIEQASVKVPRRRAKSISKPVGYGERAGHIPGFK